MNLPKSGVKSSPTPSKPKSRTKNTKKKTKTLYKPILPPPQKRPRRSSIRLPRVSRTLRKMMHLSVTCCLLVRKLHRAKRLNKRPEKPRKRRRKSLSSKYWLNKLRKRPKVRPMSQLTLRSRRPRKDKRQLILPKEKCWLKNMNKWWSKMRRRRGSITVAAASK